MPKCPCGCGRELSLEEVLGMDREGRNGFSDIFADLFGGGRARHGGMGGILSGEMFKRHLANMDPEERESILKGVPKEVLDALGVKVKNESVRKRPEHLLAETELAGCKTQIKNLSRMVGDFYVDFAESAATIKKLKKGRKKDQSQIQKLEELVADLKERMSDTQRDLKRSQGNEKSLREGIANLQTIVAGKDEEIAALAAVASLARNLREVVNGINVNASKPELQETIKTLQLAVADIPPAGGGNGADEASEEGFISGKASADSQDQIQAEEFFTAGGGCK